MSTPDDADVIRRFVLRARRIRAHSMMNDMATLHDYAAGKFTGHLAMTGVFVTKRQLPPEEVFESLAARLRPLTLASEPISYKKVFAAANRLLKGADLTADERAELKRLDKSWTTAGDLQGETVHAYSVQQSKLDGTDPTDFVSDTQLAAGWLYADLVHSDATGAKSKSLGFPMVERYAAAVRLFSHLALLTEETLRYIEALRDAGKLAVPAAAWDAEVTVGVTELVQEASAYVADVGTAAPDLRTEPGFGTDWTKLSITELLRADEGNQIAVTARDAEGVVVAAYDAAVMRRQQPDPDTIIWVVLVQHSVQFTITFTRRAEEPLGVECTMEGHNSTNELQLNTTRFFLDLDRAETLAFDLYGQELPLAAQNFMPQESRATLEVCADVLDDLVTIETITGQRIAPFTGSISGDERRNLRHVRLLWEGHMLRYGDQPIIVTMLDGIPTQGAHSPAGSFTFGGNIVPTPKLIMHHPKMTVTELESDAAGEAKAFELRPPEGAYFLCWAPERRDVEPDGDFEPTAVVAPGPVAAS